jgi:flagellar motor protein MotB
MKTDLGDVPCSGYDASQIDFPQRLAQLPQQTRDLIDVMIESAVTAESDPDAGRFCTITIVGHADRVDTPGISSESRRAQELESSTLRAESAQAFVFSEIFTRLSSQGFTAPVDLASLVSVEIQTIACGAADLVHQNPGNNTDQRKDNRRVHLIGTIFTPGTP